LKNILYSPISKLMVRTTCRFLALFQSDTKEDPIAGYIDINTVPPKQARGQKPDLRTPGLNRKVYIKGKILAKQGVKRQSAYLGNSAPSAERLDHIV
jgi:hypothetical protein